MKNIPKYHIFFWAIALLVVVLVHTHSALGQDDLAVIKDTTGDKAFAVLYPLKTATFSAEVAGVVKKVLREMGEEFKKGEPLIDLDPELYLAAKRSARATLISAQAAFRTNRELYEQKSVSEVEFAKTKAALEIARANLAIAEKELAACSIRAPHRGRIVKLLVNENEFVRQGQEMIKIVDGRTMRAKFMVHAAFYQQIKIGQKLDMKLRGIKEPLICKITHVSPVLESNTSTFQVFAETKNPNDMLRGGMTGQINLGPVISRRRDAVAKREAETIAKKASPEGLKGRARPGKELPSSKISSVTPAKRPTAVPKGGVSNGKIRPVTGTKKTLKKKNDPRRDYCYLPYTLQLSSWKTPQKTRKQLKFYKEKGLTPYAVKADLGNKSVLWEIYIGHFKTKEEAIKKKAELGLTDALVKKRPFTNLVGSFSTEKAMHNMSRKLEQLGYFSYGLPGEKDTFRLVSGAFYSRKRAEKQKADLRLEGIKAEIIPISKAISGRLSTLQSEVMPRVDTMKPGTKSSRSKQAFLNPIPSRIQSQAPNLGLSPKGE